MYIFRAARMANHTMKLAAVNRRSRSNAPWKSRVESSSGGIKASGSAGVLEGAEGNGDGGIGLGDGGT